MEYLISGTTGLSLINLAFVSATLAMIAYLLSLRHRPDEKSWIAIGHVAFSIHAVSILLAIANLFGMILTQQYQYHYVWSHSSNELPLNYAIACLWEGQEGSFLLWLSWHAILGLIFLRFGGPWRPGVLGFVASVQMILSSMVLGLYLTTSWVNALYSAALALPIGLLWYQYLRKPTQQWQGYVTILATGIALAAVINLIQGQTGFISGLFQSFQWAFSLQILLLLGLFGFLIFAYSKDYITFNTWIAGATIVLLAFVVAYVPFGDWKIGSSPFLLLRDIRPNDPIYAVDPNWIPLNGRGLNSLLQNYWMVIHPPTLFLGFASTVIPFAFVLTALIERRYTDWIRAASAWTIFSVMVLGIGIIMGGYWAYETLNFGGYWNWDPVENASFAPWLTGVASLHAMLAYRKSQTNLQLTMILVIVTFILVLYSTFLTRSGILGEASVHSFTDLGLSGQLLVLLLCYVLLISLMLVHHWNKLPADKKEIGVWSREFYLFLAAILLSFAALEVSIFTSLPVFNKILGTQYAPPARVPFFYYKWNVWFGVAIALFSAVGQFFYWTKIEKKTILNALYRPFILAVILTVAILGAMLAANYQVAPADRKWEFMFHKDFAEAISHAQTHGVWYNLIGAYISNGFLMIADDLLLLCALYTLFANAIIIYRLINRNTKNLKHIGGSLAHIGFGLMLLGMLFSAGYEHVVSTNLSPNEMADAFNEADKKENVQLWRHTPKQMREFNVVYKGKKSAKRPIQDLKVLHDDGEMAKASFRDADGFRFALDFPSKFFKEGDSKAPFQKTSQNPPTPIAGQARYDLAKLGFFIEEQLELLNPGMVNERALYELQFTNFDSTRTFSLFPEAEKSSEMGITSHPDRQIFWDRDLYVHVSSIPADNESQWKLIAPEMKLSLHQRDTIGQHIIHLKKIQSIPKAKEFYNTEFIAQATIEVTDSSGKKYIAEPMMVFDKSQKLPIMVDSYVSGLKWSFSFVTALPQENKIVLRIKQKIEVADFITVKAISKPFINLLWLGTFVMSFGFLTAIIRRVNEYRSES